MKKLLHAIKDRFKGLGEAYKRFPVTILLAVGLLAYLLVIDSAFESAQNLNPYFRVIFTWSYAILLSFVLGFLTESNRFKTSHRLVVYGLGAMIPIILYLWVLDSENMFVKDGAYIYFGLVLATILSAFLERSLKVGQRIPFKAVEVMNAFGWTVLFSLVIGVGTMMIFVMINTLFEMNWRLDRFARIIFESTILLFSVPFFISGIRKSGETVEGEYSRLFKGLLNYVCLPLAMIYTAIIYAYSIKILLTWEWPQGLVSHLVLWYSFFVVILFMFLRAQKKQLPKGLDYFPLVVVPLMAMMFMSIGLRIQQYGFTPNRYFVVLAGIFSTFALIYVGLKKKYSPWWLIAALVLFILVGTNSPLGAYDVSNRSQQAILINELEKNQMLEGEKVQANSAISKESKVIISSGLDYFSYAGALDTLPFLPPDFTLKDFDTTFGFALVNTRHYEEEQYISYYAEPNLSFTVDGFVILANVSTGSDLIVDGYTFSLTERAVRIKTPSGAELELDLSFADSLESSKGSGDLIERSIDDKTYALVRNLNGRRQGGQTIVDYIEFILIVK